MKSNYLLFLPVIAVILILGFYLITQKTNSLRLLAPQGKAEQSPKVAPSPTLTPTPTPPIFNYNRSTNLKEELEKVSPQVDSSDFVELKKLINSL